MKSLPNERAGENSPGRQLKRIALNRVRWRVCSCFPMFPKELRCLMKSPPPDQKLYINVKYGVQLVLKWYTSVFSKQRLNSFKRINPLNPKENSTTSGVIDLCYKATKSFTK